MIYKIQQSTLKIQSNKLEAKHRTPQNWCFLVHILIIAPSLDFIVSKSASFHILKRGSVRTGLHLQIKWLKERTTSEVVSLLV